MAEKVSILIPAYNAKRWISQTINSAIKQTWENKEIIVVDDGSKDETYLIAKSFESKNIKVIRQKNCGAAAARNHAFALSQGDFIQWLDSDDLLSPDKISIQMRGAEGEKKTVLLSSEFGIFNLYPSNAKFNKTNLWKDLSPVDWIVTKFENNLWMNPAVWLVSRELAVKAGTWNESLSLDDDGEYFCRVVANSEFVKFVVGAKCYYRQWNYKSLSRDVSIEGCESLLNSLILSATLLLSIENTERTRSAVVRYMNIWTNYFYPEHKSLFERLNNYVNSIGKTLQPPKLSMNYQFIQKLFGYSIAKKAKSYSTMMKLYWRLIHEQAGQKIKELS
jgi:glycosyltransferase involved in cell wall biosynthesis